MNYVPDSGWAVLQMVLNYFETIALFKLGAEGRKLDNGQRFVWGVIDVFDYLEPNKDAVTRILWGQFRTRMYHYSVEAKLVWFIQWIANPSIMMLKWTVSPLILIALFRH